jgi:hypothetical protein
MARHVSAPEHGIHPPEKLLFFSPKVFRRILKISQRGLCWLRGREKSPKAEREKKPAEVLKVPEVRKETWGCYEPTNLIYKWWLANDRRRWERVSDYFRGMAEYATAGEMGCNGNCGAKILEKV